MRLRTAISLAVLLAAPALATAATRDSRGDAQVPVTMKIQRELRATLTRDGAVSRSEADRLFATLTSTVTRQVRDARETGASLTAKDSLQRELGSALVSDLDAKGFSSSEQAQVLDLASQWMAAELAAIATR